MFHAWMGVELCCSYDRIFVSNCFIWRLFAFDISLLSLFLSAIQLGLTTPCPLVGAEKMGKRKRFDNADNQRCVVAIGYWERFYIREWMETRALCVWNLYLCMWTMLCCNYRVSASLSVDRMLDVRWVKWALLSLSRSVICTHRCFIAIVRSLVRVFGHVHICTVLMCWYVCV